MTVPNWGYELDRPESHVPTVAERWGGGCMQAKCTLKTAWDAPSLCSEDAGPSAGINSKKSFASEV
jgi:hypothetical protein